MVLFQNPFAKLGKRKWTLYLCSLAAVTVSAVCGGTVDALSLCTSLVGVTALIFLAGGDVWGQILTCVFSVMYAIVSLRLHYYSEAITYLGMSGPIAAFSVISWLKNPFEAGKNIVKIHRLTRREIFCMVAFTLAVTVGGYFLLTALETPRLPIATLSIATSFLASYLMFYRNSYYALAYAANDVVLIVLWVLASRTDIRYLAVVACFAAFLANDVYAFCRWRLRETEQKI